MADTVGLEPASFGSESSSLSNLTKFTLFVLDLSKQQSV